ncbi:MAG: hypothetical protein NT116_05155, partial [Candidatus Parcubacteria bacterium]|nr:hypothetical protein [Candidatus Parcubacteria bacterium]
MAEVTPMLKQYREIKDKHQDCILFFRLGDFYEMFGPDALEACKILNITLTARGKGTPNEVPMCGIPYHAADGYIAKLTRAGKKVAICEQLTDPELPGIVERDVIRIITPGTTLDNNILENKRNNYLVSLVSKDNLWGLAFVDLTTGEFKLAEIRKLDDLINELARIMPSEIIITPDLNENLQLVTKLKNLSSLNIFYPAIFNPAGELDQTQTGMGGRLLRNWLLHPLIKTEKIQARLDAVSEFYNKLDLRENSKSELKNIFDIERLIGRLGCKRANARDLVNLKNSLQQIPQIKALIKNCDSKLLKDSYKYLDEHKELVGLIQKSISEDPPLIITDGGMIADGYNAELDELRGISTTGKDWLKDLQTREIQRSGISTLKVKFNKIFGYYIEVTNSNLGQVPTDYTRKQTLVNAERFVTPELKEYEQKVLGAQEKIIEIEQRLFWEIRDQVAKHFEAIQATAQILAQLDVLLNFANIALLNNYVAPEINDGGEIVI